MKLTIIGYLCHFFFVIHSPVNGLGHLLKLVSSYRGNMIGKINIIQYFLHQIIATGRCLRVSFVTKWIFIVQFAFTTKRLFLTYDIAYVTIWCRCSNLCLYLQKLNSTCTNYCLQKINDCTRKSCLPFRNNIRYA
jgi:hypothetical protein